MKTLFLASLLVALALPIRANAMPSSWTFSSEEMAAALADDSEDLAIPANWTCIAVNRMGKRFIKTGASQAQAWLRAFGDCGETMAVRKALRDCNVTRCFRNFR